MWTPRNAVGLVVAVALLGSPLALAVAGVRDTPPPTFSDGKPAELVALISGVVKHSGLETDVMCTNLAAGPVDVGVELFDEAGQRGNSIGAGNGAVLNVAPGQTVTIGTANTMLLHEDAEIMLEAPVTGLRNGSARVIATSTKVGCVAFALDKLHSIQDPATCPTCKTPYLATLPVSTFCSPASCDDGNPCTDDGCDDAGGCTHLPTTEGTPCDDGDVCTTDDACRAGLCSGTPLVCGADTPCDQSAVCEAASGRCVDTAPFSTCVPGGGDRTTDCTAEWVVDNPGNPKGRTASVQLCKQGDHDCDFDIDPRQCTFRVRVCLNNVDVDLQGCAPSQVSAYELRAPTPRSRRRWQRADATTLLDGVAALAPSGRGGKRKNRVVFAVPEGNPAQCTPALPVVVPLKQSLRLKVRATTPAGVTDKDKLRLRCVRRSGKRTASRGGLAGVVHALLAYLNLPAASYF